MCGLQLLFAVFGRYWPSVFLAILPTETYKANWLSPFVTIR
jgi:hypothetical protein